MLLQLLIASRVPRLRKIVHSNTHVNFRVNDVDETSEHDDEIEDVPRVTEVIL